jgi:hypothetical protein
MEQDAHIDSQSNEEKVEDKTEKLDGSRMRDEEEPDKPVEKKDKVSRCILM